LAHEESSPHGLFKGAWHALEHLGPTELGVAGVLVAGVLFAIGRSRLARRKSSQRGNSK
jgi:hypothetical protein